MRVVSVSAHPPSTALSFKQKPTRLMGPSLASLPLGYGPDGLFEVIHMQTDKASRAHLLTPLFATSLQPDDEHLVGHLQLKSNEEGIHEGYLEIMCSVIDPARPSLNYDDSWERLFVIERPFTARSVFGQSLLHR